MENKKRKGFTLPEILVVVAILILLVGIAIPGYERLTQKSDVSDALHNLEMLASAQNKYFVANGAYTRNLSALETPLRSSEKNAAIITTNNFTYSASASSADKEKNCVFSESTKNDYVLAYNYKTNEGPICSGSYCSEISNVVREGSVAELCGKNPFGGCEGLKCEKGYHADEEACECVCDRTCGTYAERDAEGCGCHCIGQAVDDCKHYDECELLFNCTCKINQKICDKEGNKHFDAAKCECVDEEVCDLTEEFCNTLKKVLDLSNCQCVDPSDPNQFCDKACPAGKILNDKCECVCADGPCGGNFVRNKDTCKCECNAETECPPGQKLDEKTCSCVCGVEQAECTPYQNLTSDCNCQCAATQSDKDTCNSTQNFKWDEKACDCICKIRDKSDCPSDVYVVDTKACKCVLEGECSLTDSDCKDKYGEGYIVNQAECQCVESACLEHEICPPNIEWDYRLCKCSGCALTQEYCKEHGNRTLNEKTCTCDECTTTASECEANNQVLNPDTCACECSAETTSACSQPDNRLEEEEGCTCYCDTPSKIPGQGHQTFNSDPAVCKWECNYDCMSPWKKNEEKCSCECDLDESKCKDQNPNYSFRTSGEEVCECYCSLDQSKCTDQNSNYTFDSSNCSCSCDLDQAKCQTSSGNPYYDVNDAASCQCQCSGSLLSAEVSRRNGTSKSGTNPVGHFWEADLSSCQPRCPITGDSWCSDNYGASYLAATGGDSCYCYQSSCSAQTCYNNNGNGHWDYRACQCQCDIDAAFCSSQGKVFDASACECKTGCSLNEEKCKEQNANYTFDSSPYSDCSCQCSLNNTICGEDHGKVLTDTTDCRCACNNECPYPHQVRNESTCACGCDDLQCTGYKVKDEETCNCSCNESSLEAHCSGLDRSYTGGDTCACGNCLAIECSGKAVVNNPANTEQACGCTCDTSVYNDSYCINNKGANWRMSGLPKCDCECSQSAVDSAVTAKRNSTGSNYWIAQYGNTCAPVCDVASLSSYCSGQHKNYDAESCTCSGCQNNCTYPHQVQDPETCECPTCDDLVCSGNWVKDPETCNCTCPASVQTSCENQGRAYNPGTCSCGECNAQDCANPYEEFNTSSCSCECSSSLLNAEVSSRGGEWTANMGTCQPNCPVTGQSWCTEHYDANHVPSTGGNNCSCPCGGNDTCSSQHGGNADWKMNGSCGCYCSIDSTTCQQRNSNLNYKVNGDCECVCNTSASCGSKKHLNESTCQCECNTVLSCGTNKDWDSTTCQCGSCKLNSCPAGKVLVETETDCYCDDSCKAECSSPKVKQDDPCGCVCGSYSWNANSYGSCPNGTVANSSDCTCECSSSCASPKELNSSCDCVCPYYTKQGSETHYNSCPENFTTNNINCTCDCGVSCKSGETKHNDTCTCTCDKNAYDNFTVDENCEYQCSHSAVDSAVTAKRSSTGSSNWVADYTNGVCGPVCSIDASDCGNKNFDATNCKCTDCKNDCPYPHQAQDPETCGCEECDDLVCSGYKTKDSACECNSCDASGLQTHCAGLNRSYTGGATCACSSTCLSSSCSGNATVSNPANTEQACGCTCDTSVYNDSYCQSSNSNWRMNSNVLICDCECNHAAVDSAVTAKRNSTGSNSWVANYEKATCRPVCSISAEDCGNKNFDAENCKCIGCKESCTYPHQVQDPETCECDSCDDLTCTGYKTKNSTTCECSECNTEGLTTYCASQNRVPNTTTCECGDCITDACDNGANEHWTRNSSTCQCTSCSLTDSDCPGADWKANNTSGNCSCYCAATESESYCSTTYGANYVADVSGCGCRCSVNEKYCESIGRVYNSGTCSCDCKKTQADCDEDWQLNPNTCECTCALPANTCTYPKELNSGTCACECSNTCSGNWIQNKNTCACSCGLTDSSCRSEHGNNLNYYANQDTCTCECGLTSCPGEAVLTDCTCSCPLTPQSCKLSHGTNYTVDTYSCSCVEMGSNTQCVEPWVNDGNGGCTCSLTREYCENLGLILPKFVGVCECVEPADANPCQAPWVPMYQQETFTGCECGLNPANCPVGTTFNGQACMCVQEDDTAQLCNDAFLYSDGECKCGLTEEICQKQGKTLYTAGKEVCECVPTSVVSCAPPWELAPAGNRCECNLTSEDCPYPWVPNATSTRCECTCGQLHNDNFCSPGFAVDPVTCMCQRQCPSIPNCSAFEILNMSTCRCECNIDSTFCSQAYDPPRYFNPANCTCSRYLI